MRGIKLGNRKIYKMEDGNILLETGGDLYILCDNKWINDEGRPYRNINNIDKSILNELDLVTEKN